MRLLVTRPQPQGDALARRLRALGHEALAAPLLEIEFLPGPPNLEGVGALLFTSANGVAAFSRSLEVGSGVGALRVLTVGGATADAARAAGFLNVESAEGDAAALLALARERAAEISGRLLHISGEDQALDLSGALSGAGIAAERHVAYRARAAERLPDAVRTALKTGDVDGVLFFSPRTAESFASLCARDGLSERCRTLTAFCLSPAVAEAAALPWRAVRIAARPDQESLLELLSS